MSAAPLRLTREQADTLTAILEARWDLEIWARDVLGVDINPAQRRWFSLINPAESGWEWRLKRVLHVAANQIGKTLGLAIIILWACWFKIGVPTTEGKKWFAAPYQWFHVAPSQNQAYLTLKDISLLIGGAHPAQVRESRLPKGLISEVKIETYYDGLQFWNGAIVQFRTTEDKAKALQGRRAAGISMDECAFEDWFKSVLNETLLMRLISTGGPFIGVSTPNGINDWYNEVHDIVNNAEPREVAEEGHPLLGGSAHVGQPLPIWHRSDDPHALVWSTVEDNVGFGISRAEADRMERDLDESTKEQQLRGAFLEPADAFFTPVKNILRCFTKLPATQRPIAGHSYVIAWDPSFASDPTAVVVLDVTRKPWVGVYFKHYPKPLGDTQLLVEIFALHALYNGGGMELAYGQKRPSAITVYDETSMGGAMLKAQLTKMTPKKGINLAGPATKVNLLTNLRTALNTLNVLLPQAWGQLQTELLNYKLPDTKIRQDSVMALVEAVAVAASGWSGSAGSRSFRPSGRVTQVGRR